jgi:predicted dehydrogenase
MLSEVDLDVVSIAVPGGLHHEIVLAAAAAGCHVLCEKPFATSVAEGREMLSAVQQAGVRHAINHEFRMLPARQTFRAMVGEGFLGDPFDVRALLDMGMLLNPTRAWSWWSDRAQYGGMLQAMSSHLIDFLLWTCGDIASLSGRVDTFIRSRQDSGPATHLDCSTDSHQAEDGAQREVTSDDQNAALLRFANGATGLLHVSGVSRAQRSLIEVHGSRGSLALDGNKLQSAREPGKFEPVEVTPLAGEGQVVLMTAYLAHVARVFRGSSDENVATFEQGLRVQAVMDAIHQSSSQGGARVELIPELV